MPTPLPDSALRTPPSALGDRLAGRWIAFGRLLRRNGVVTTAGQMRDLLRALPLLDLADRRAVYYAARALLCARREDLPRFDLIFRQFWGRTRQIIIPSDTAAPPERGAAPPLDDGRWTMDDDRSLPEMERVTLTDGEDGDAGIDVGDDTAWQRALLYSAQERLRTLDFARFTDEELAAAKRLLATWAWQPPPRRTHRLAPARRGRRFDFRRTVRGAMQSGGVPIRLAWRGPRRKPRPLVLLCDISGSMAPYTRLLLHFLHTLRRGVGQAEVFVFGTRLTRITRQLQVRDVDRALAEVNRQVVDWAGGTRTGEALRAFNTHWARRVLGQGAVVCIISDGWDRGDPAVLVAELAHLQRSAFRLIWLNPLLGLPGYQPLTRGMAAALPFVDDFLPIHNLASLAHLAALLRSLDLTARPARRRIASPARPASPAPPPPPRFSVTVPAQNDKLPTR